MYLTVHFLIKIHYIKTGSNNISLRSVDGKSYGLHKMCMDKYLI